MKIGILTFLHVSNFGANLQALSTYCYLKNNGHVPVFLDYTSWQTNMINMFARKKRQLLRQEPSMQSLEHKRFIDKEIEHQIANIHTCKQVFKALQANNIEAVIIGSDAVAQHWPLFSTLKCGTHRPYWIEPLQQERRFPNPFWGCGFAQRIPTAMMSVSSQNSKYHLFGRNTLARMAKQLHQMTYISVRDEWTRDMMLKAAPNLDIDITPDPVFALNQNAGGLIPSKEHIIQKFNLPDNYVLIGMHSQAISYAQLSKLKELMKKERKECVSFCITGKYAYSHPFDYQIPLPISPLEWYSIIKHATAYIGSNMHPIVSSLANAVPCFSLDNWGSVDFWGRKKQDASSKVYDVLKQYGIERNRAIIENGICNVDVEEIVEKLLAYPVEQIKYISEKRLEIYNNMMTDILNSFDA